MEIKQWMYYLIFLLPVHLAFHNQKELSRSIAYIQTPKELRGTEWKFRFFLYFDVVFLMKQTAVASS